MTRADPDAAILQHARHPPVKIASSLSCGNSRICSPCGCGCSGIGRRCHIARVHSRCSRSSCGGSCSGRRRGSGGAGRCGGFGGGVQNGGDGPGNGGQEAGNICAGGCRRLHSIAISTIISAASASVWFVAVETRNEQCESRGQPDDQRTLAEADAATSLVTEARAAAAAIVLAPEAVAAAEAAAPAQESSVMASTNCMWTHLRSVCARGSTLDIQQQMAQQVGATAAKRAPAEAVADAAALETPSVVLAPTALATVLAADAAALAKAAASVCSRLKGAVASAASTLAPID